MELIPAIDLLNNIVVKAFSGERKKYKPINSKITNSFKLERVLECLLEQYKFKVIYIADLNAIMGNKNNYGIIKTAVKNFPMIDFWVDPGVKTFSDFKKFSKIPCKTIIGSETLKNINELKKIKKHKKRFILSLDIKDDFFLGPLELVNNQKLWPKKNIFMILNSIGSKKRPKLTKLKKLGFNLKKDFYLAGGVSSNSDINFLKKKGFKGVILSTAIHEKKIHYKNL
tara:strand:+ start:1210 stop:1890 length:681 start_codon:yes stop_codon:yes gene_type:complete